MKNKFTIENIKKSINSEQILEGLFGIEREGLRIHSNGELALTPHPEIFGDKLKNPVITTDFSESQIEIVTPCLDSIEKTHNLLNTLTDIVNTNIPENEYFWNQSLPCILPPFEKIPIAEYREDENSKEARKYREGLVKKYGTQKQMISGIHYNFSFGENTIKTLYEKLKTTETYREFKNNIYLKVTRNYLRYGWLIIYLTGSTIAAHKTFTQECLKQLNKQDKNGGYYSNQGPSIRNGSTGYKNLMPLYPRYDTVENFITDVKTFIKEGKLTQAKELYTPIRLKPKDNNNLLESLKNDGIQYVEIRTIDINPFEKTGISKEDMEFVHLFMIYLLIKDETNYPKWQEEGDKNVITAAEEGYLDSLLIKDGVEIKLNTWANEILENIKEINSKLNLNKENIIKVMEDRINNPKNTYGRRLLELIENNGYLDTNINFALENKDLSIENINKRDDLLVEYEKIALFNK